MQRFSHKPSLVLENKIFKCFFPYKCMRKQTWPCCKTVKCQCMTIILATLVDPLSPMIYANIQPQSILGSREEDFWRFFTIYGHGGHLCQQTMTILAIFCSPYLRRPSWSANHDHFSNLLFPLPKEAPYEIWAKLAQRLQRRSCLKFWTFFPYKCIRKQNLPYRKMVKCQCTTIILAILVALLFPKIYAKIQP